MKYSIIIIISALFVTACERALDIPFPTHEKKLVVNAFLDPEKPVDVYLSRSYGTLEKRDQDFSIADATVELFEGINSLGTLTYRDSVALDTMWDGNVREIRLSKYELPDHKPIAGKSYRLEISHKDYPSVSSETNISNPFTVSEVKLEQNVARLIEVDFTEHQSLLTLKLSDPAGEKNYYRFKAVAEITFPQEPEPILYEFYLGGPANWNGAHYTSDTEWVTDEGKDGTEMDISLLALFPTTFDGNDQPVDMDIDAIHLTVYSANEDTYRYLTKLQSQYDISEDISFFPSESVVVYNNIEGGFGILGGLHTQRLYISL